MAGPYSGPTPEAVELNVRNAIDAGIAVYKKGHIPFIPHLSHWVELRALETVGSIPYQEYLDWDIVWLKLCQGFLYLKPSPGADKELEIAKSLGLKIFYSIEEVYEARKYSLAELVD